MNNNFTLLYDLCERTYTSRILEKTIEAINSHLQKLANQTRSTAVIAVTDISETNPIDDILVGFHMVFPNTICVNIGVIKNISFSSIYDFIRQYYEDQNINVSINETNGDIELSWENKIQEYLDANTKASDILNTPMIVERICTDIETFMSDCGTNVISLWFTFSEYMNDGYDVDGNASNKLFHLTIPKTETYYDITENICNYFKNSEKYDIDVDANAVTKAGTAPYILVKLQSFDDTNKDQNDDRYIDVNKVIKEIESFLQICSRVRKTKYIHLVIIFCDLNLEEDIFDGDLDNITYTIKLPNNNRGQAFLGDIYQYFQDNNKYDIEFRPIANLSENRKYEIRYHIEDEIDDAKSTSDAIAHSEKITAETADSRNKADTTKSSDDSNSNNRIQDLPDDVEYKNVMDKIHDAETIDMIGKEISNLPLNEISNFLFSHLKDEKLDRVIIAVTNPELVDYLYTPIKVDLYKYTINTICDIEYIGNWIFNYFGSELSSYSFKQVATAYDNNGKPGYILYEVTLKE